MLLDNETKQFITKIIIPAFIAGVVKIAIEVKQGNATFWNSVLSILIGVGTAYIFGEYILETISDKYVILSVGFIAIIGDKIGSWLVYQFRVDAFLTKLTDALIETLTKRK